MKRPQVYTCPFLHGGTDLFKVSQGQSQYRAQVHCSSRTVSLFVNQGENLLTELGESLSRYCVHANAWRHKECGVQRNSWWGPEKQLAGPKSPGIPKSPRIPLLPGSIAHSLEGSGQKKAA